MDGTVLDSEGLFDQAQLLLLKEFNIVSSAYDLEEFKGMSYKDFYPLFMNEGSEYWSYSDDIGFDLVYA